MPLTASERNKKHYQKNRVNILAKSRQYSKDNPEKIAERQRKSYAKMMADPTRKAKHDAVFKAAEERRGVDYWRSHHLMKKYGLTLEDYSTMLANQNGVCAICKCERPKGCRMKGSNLFVDHDHKTGRVRGLLCAPCNTHISTLDEYKDEVEAYLYSPR